MSWQRHSQGIPPIYWMRVPQHVWDGIRVQLGLHHGYWLTKDGKDRKLTQAFERSESSVEKKRVLREWISFVDRESSLKSPGYSAIWHPSIINDDHMLIRQWAGKRLIEISAETTEDALHLFRQSSWVLGHFYHCACMGRWKEVVEEQLALAARVGLNCMYVGLLGSDEDRKDFEGIARLHGIVADIRYHHYDLLMYEIPTMRLVADYAATHPDNYCLYWHTKGVSDTQNEVKTKWRKLMDREVIGEWKRNVEYLKNGIDSVGVNWRNIPPNSHWAGNYWLSKCSFLNSLAEFSHYYRHPRHYNEHSNNQLRLAAEFWHGSGVPMPSIKSLVSYNENPGSASYWSKPGRV